MNKTVPVILLLTLAALIPAATSVRAVVIPLDGTSGERGGSSPESIAYVDLEKIFTEHPLTRRFREELNADIEKRRSELALMESEIVQLDSIIISSSAELGRMQAERDALSASAASSVPVAPPDISSGTAAASAVTTRITALDNGLRDKAGGIEKFRQEMRRKKTALNARARQNKDDLVALEQQQSHEVMADIYHLLDKLSDEENITIIFDKTGLVYGKKIRDITPKVIERLQGR